MSSELRALWTSAGGHIPDDWDVVTLETLLIDSKSIAVGVMYPGPHTPNGVPLIKVGDIHDGAIVERPTYCISEKTNEEYRRTQLRGDELLITLVGNPGECVIVKPFMSGWNPARAIAVLKLRDTSIRTYLKAILESKAGKHLIDAVLNTTVQKTLNLKDIKRLPIPLPARHIRDQISQLAEIFADRITLLRETNKTLESIAQAIFKSWFVDFDPVRAKMEGRQPEGMDEDTAALFPDSFEESELGLVPRGWRWGTIGEIATLQNGYAFKSKDWTTAGYPVVKIGDVKPGVIDLSSCSFVSEDTVKGLTRFKLHRGDLLVGMTGYVGETGLVPAAEPAPYLNQRVGRIAALEGGNGIGYIYCAIRKPTFKEFAEAQSHGSAQANVSGASLMAYPIIVGGHEVVSAFNKMVGTVIETILSNHEYSETLATLRDTILPRLISGQLHLPLTNPENRTACQ